MILKKVIIGAGAVLAMAVSTVVVALPAGVEGYGVYIKSADRYQPVTTYDAEVVKIQTMKNVLNIDDVGSKVELLIYQKEFDRTIITFKKSDFSSLSVKNDLKYNIDSVKGEKDLYKVSFNDHYQDAHVLYVDSHQLFGWNQGAVVLGDIQKGLEKTLGDKSRNPIQVLDELEAAIKEFPDNKEFKRLLPQVEAAKAELEAERLYAYADEQWEGYENAKSRKSKVYFLERCKKFLVSYIETYPNGKKVSEAKKRIKTIESKLDI